MDEVAAKAAISKPTVYKYFSDKEHLFAEIMHATAGEIDDHPLVLPFLLDPFGGPCASMAATATLTPSGSEAVTSRLSGCPVLHLAIRQLSLAVQMGVRKVKVVFNPSLATRKHSDQQST